MKRYGNDFERGSTQDWTKEGHLGRCFEMLLEDNETLPNTISIYITGHGITDEIDVMYMDTEKTVQWNHS